jgi:hypothetical protein
MADIVKFSSKADKDAESLLKFKEDSLNEYYNNMANLKDSIDTVLTLIINKDGDLVVSSNGMTAKDCLWTIEEFKLNCLFNALTEI